MLDSEIPQGSNPLMQMTRQTLNPIHMKTIVKILAGLLLLAVIYFVAADGMMVHFGLNQGIQYAFNFGAILILIPFCIFAIVQDKMAYEE